MVFVRGVVVVYGGVECCSACKHFLVYSMIVVVVVWYNGILSPVVCWVVVGVHVSDQWYDA